ncbi:MAG: tetratricopeptide repeat protein [Methanomicrobiales archaeon]
MVELVKFGHYNDTLDLVNTVIKFDNNNNNKNVWYNKGSALMELEKYLDKIRAFDTVLKINPLTGQTREQRNLTQKEIKE